MDRYRKVSLTTKSKPDTTFLLSMLDEIASQNPNCIDTYLARGDIFSAKGNSPRAHFDYNTVIANDRQNVYAYYKLGLLCQKDGSFDSSVYYLRTALNLKSYGNWVVDFKHINKDLETEEKRYDVPANSLFYTLGISLYYNRSLTKALTVFDLCIDNNYVLEQSYLFRGAIYEEMKKPDSACEDFIKAKMFGNVEADDYLKKYCK